MPRHVAIIMDGNGRWARARGLPTLAGHRAGADVIRRHLDACRARGIAVLTLFAFSSENWRRPREEVRGLMALFIRYLRSEVQRMQRNGVRLRIVGERSRFPPRLARLMAEAEESTAGNAEITLVIAADYGGQWDVAQAARSLAEDAVAGRIDPAAIDARQLEARLSLADLPHPDLLVRTGGDHRISNFLLWQLAYAELHFTDCYWPDFDEARFDAALADFASRERRYGGRPGGAGIGA
ncbi:MAG: polyprenyl diphosphate synthase [Gammaproteobacteria bacterium]